MPKNLHFSIIKNPEEIEILHDKKSFNYTYNRPTIELLKKNFHLPESLYILVTIEDRFAAFCSMDRDWWEDNYFFLREILVDPNFQNQNIGSKLMERFIQHAKENGATGIVTETDFNNLAMQKLCAKFNFQKWNNPQWKEGITYKLLF